MLYVLIAPIGRNSNSLTRPIVWTLPRPLRYRDVKHLSGESFVMFMEGVAWSINLLQLGFSLALDLRLVYIILVYIKKNIYYF